jgi:hypothetical protein
VGKNGVCYNVGNWRIKVGKRWVKMGWVTRWVNCGVKVDNIRVLVNGYGYKMGKLGVG